MNQELLRNYCENNSDFYFNSDTNSKFLTEFSGLFKKQTKNKSFLKIQHCQRFCPVSVSVPSPFRPRTVTMDWLPPD